MFNLFFANDNLLKLVSCLHPLEISVCLLTAVNTQLTELASNEANMQPVCTLLNAHFERCNMYGFWGFLRGDIFGSASQLTMKLGSYSV